MPSPWVQRMMRDLSTDGAPAPAPEEVPMTATLQADTLRADAAAIERLADADERAANSIGFGSDRAASYRAEARRLRAQADAIEPVAIPDSFMHRGADYEADAAWDDSVAWVEVPVVDVPRLLRAGVEVWSFGYGWDSDDDGFATLDESDLWAFVGPDRDADVVSSWGPFAVAFEDAQR